MVFEVEKVILIINVYLKFIRYCIFDSQKEPIYNGLMVYNYQSVASYVACSYVWCHRYDVVSHDADFLSLS